jgi:O-antigen ligase
LYVAKDLALMGSLALFALRSDFRLCYPLRQSLLPILWGAFVFFVCLQAFNLNVPSLTVGLLGIRSYLLYTVLLFILPIALERIQQPKRLLLLVSLLLIVPVLLLGMYQYSQPVGSWINQYVADDTQAVGVLSRPRITGTFSYIGGMGAFLSFTLFFSLGTFLAGLHFRDRLYQLLGASLLSLALIVAPMNGSRGVVLGLLVPLPIVLYTVFRRRRGVAVGATLLALTVAGAYAASESAWLTQGWEIIEHRMSSSSDQEKRLKGIFLDPLQKVKVGGLIGYGAGTTHQAAGALSSDVPNIPVGYEGELGRVVLELGIIGAAIFVGMKAWLAWMAWQAMRRSATTWTMLLSITGFSVLFLNLGVGMIVFNHISGALYWICAGCVAWVWSRQEHQLAHRGQSTQEVYG